MSSLNTWWTERGGLQKTLVGLGLGALLGFGLCSATVSSGGRGMGSAAASVAYAGGVVCLLCLGGLLLILLLAVITVIVRIFQR